MPVVLKNQTSSLGGSFKKFRYYNFPKNQRPYSWGKREVNKLLDDLYIQFDDDPSSSYFIGTILFYIDKDDKYCIIDGQQRITTLSLILAAFLNETRLNYKAWSKFKELIQALLIDIDLEGDREVIRKRISSEADYLFDAGLHSIFIKESLNSIPTESKSTANLIENYKEISSFIGDIYERMQAKAKLNHEGVIKQKINEDFSIIFKDEELNEIVSTSGLTELIYQFGKFSPKNKFSEVSKAKQKSLQLHKPQLKLINRFSKIINSCDKFKDILENNLEDIESIMGSNDTLKEEFEEKNYSELLAEAIKKTATKMKKISNEYEEANKKNKLIKDIIKEEQEKLTIEILNQIASVWFNSTMIDFYHFLVKQTHFLELEVDEEKSFDIFEVLNSRGKQLTQFDLFKNYVLKENEADDQIPSQTNLSAQFESLDKKLHSAGGIKNETFLRYYLLANYEFKQTKIMAKSIYTEIRNNQAINREISRKAGDFLNSLNKTAEQLQNFLSGNLPNGIQSESVDSFITLNSPTLNQYSGLILGAFKLDQQNFELFVKNMEELEFYMLYTKSQANKIEKELNNWAKEIRVSVNIEDDLKQDYLSTFYKDKLHLLTREISPYLPEYISNLSYGKKDNFKIKFLLAKVQREYERNGYGERQQSSQGSMSFLCGKKSKFDIEHIKPSSSTDQKHSEEIDNISINSLGNLTLLEEQLNKMAASKPYSYKKEKIYGNSSLVITKSLGKKQSEDNRIEKKKDKSYKTKTEEKQAMMDQLVPMNTAKSWGNEEIKERKKLYLRTILQVYNKHS